MHSKYCVYKGLFVPYNNNMRNVACSTCKNGFYEHMIMGMSGDILMYKCIRCGTIANYYFVCNCEANIHSKRGSKRTSRRREVNSGNSKIHIKSSIR